VLPSNAPAWIDRLLTWLEPFESVFGHVAQRGSFRRYLLGLLSDSPRKSMSAMLARVSDPGSYQAFQHFITSAPWAADRLWRQCSSRVSRACHSTGCQVVVTAALWTGAQAWLLGARLYLPEEWLTPAQRARAHIGAAVRLQEKWRLALTLVRQTRAARFEITAVLGDAEFGDNTRRRRALHRAGLPYALGISSDLTVFRDTPRLVAPRRRTGGGRRAIRPRLPDGLAPIAVHALAASWPRWQWRPVRWRNSPHARQWSARFAATRVTPAHKWRQQLMPEVWLLAEQDTGATPRTKYYLIHLPRTTSLRALVRLAH
jgi:SRSO17 transposase